MRLHDWAMDQVAVIHYTITGDSGLLFDRVMARMKHRDKMSMDRAKHSPHPHEGDENACAKCGLPLRNSVHGDMDKIAQQIADREARGDRPEATHNPSLPAGEGARATNIRLKEPPKDK